VKDIEKTQESEIKKENRNEIDAKKSLSSTPNTGATVLGAKTLSITAISTTTLSIHHDCLRLYF
jgi:hypothetical protein